MRTGKAIFAAMLAIAWVLRIVRALAVVATTILIASPAQAQLHGYVVDGLHPQGGQRGTSVTVLLQGSTLEHIEEVLFYQPGIRCTAMEPTDTVWDHRSGKPLKAESGKAATLTLEIADDAPLGEHQLRVRTRDNLSELVTFWVTPFPIVDEAHQLEDTENPEHRNDSPKFSQPIPMNCTVSGFIPNYVSQDHDWYRVECTKGQRLSVEVWAARLGLWHAGGMNDPSIQVYDEKGTQLATNDDNALHTQDPVVSIVLPEDGSYFINMRQQMDYENSLRHYLMHVGDFARPMVAFPLGGPAGQPLELTLLGDAKGPQQLTVLLPRDPGPFEGSIHDIYFRDGETPASPWPNRIQVAPFDNVIEQPGHNAPDNPQTISQLLPIALNGIIQSEGEVDWYRFSAKKGDRYRVRTYAMTLDSELDAKVFLRPAPGNDGKKSYEEDDSRWEPHDLVGHHYRWQVKQRLDPIFMFEPDTDGDWLIGITDTRREFGPHHVYRIEFQPHVDSAFVHFPQYPSQTLIVRDRIVVYRGHSYSRPVSIQPGFGSQYNKPLHLRGRDLPAGVSMHCKPFTQNDGIIQVLFEASDDAEVGAHALDLIVEPVDPKDRGSFRGGFVQVTQATNRRGDYAMYFNRTRKAALAVVDGATFDLEIQQPAVPLVLDGELPLTVKVNRHAGFDGAVYCEMDWLPAGVNKQPPLIIPTDQTESTYTLTARSNTTPGTYRISITGRENEGGNVRTAAGFHYVCSPLVSLDVGEPFLKVTLLRSAIERGKVGAITGEVEHLKPFAGDATLSLGRLPFGVEQVKPLPTVKPGQKTVEFKVKATADCLLGQYKDIYCEAIVEVDGQVIRQQSGNGLLRVDAERR